MKKIFSLALAAQMFVLVPHGALAQGFQQRRGPPVIHMGPVGPQNHMHRPGPPPRHFEQNRRRGNGLGELLTGIVIGAGIAFALSRLSDGDNRVLYRGAGDCINGYSQDPRACDRPVYLPESRTPVQIRPHQRVYYSGQPNECKSFFVVQNGQTVGTRVLCQQGNQWGPPQAHWGQPQYFDRPHHDPRMRRWDYNAHRAPVVVAPQVVPIGPGRPGPGFQQQRPGVVPGQVRVAPPVASPTGGFVPPPRNPPRIISPNGAVIAR